MRFGPGRGAAAVAAMGAVGALVFALAGCGVGDGPAQTGGPRSNGPVTTGMAPGGARSAPSTAESGDASATVTGPGSPHGAGIDAAATARGSGASVAAGEALTPDIGTALIGHVVVGGRTVLESRLVAEVYAQSLEAAGFEVSRQFTFALSRDANQALIASAIDLYPERVGDAAEHVLGLSPARDGPPPAATVRDAYALFGLTWLAPAPFGGVDALAPVVRTELLATMPEMARVLDAASARLTDDAMARLTVRVSRDRREPAVAVGEMLAAATAGPAE